MLFLIATEKLHLFFYCIGTGFGCNIKLMKIVLLIVFSLLMIPSAFADGIQTFSFGGTVGYATLYGGPKPRFTVEPYYGVRFETYLKGKYRLELTLSRFKIDNDSSTDSDFKFGSDPNYRTRTWKGYDLTMIVGRRFSPYTKPFSFLAGVGGGLSIWKMVDPKADTVLKVEGAHGNTVDFAASEIFVTLTGGMEFQFEKHVKLGLTASINYLTGLGLEFNSRDESDRSRWNLKAGLFLSYFLFKKEWASKWTNEKYVLPPPIVAQKTVPEKIDTETITTLKENDSDHDGIPDIDDECPKTPSEARGKVDIRGCPIDSDRDGYPDYLDSCPNNRIGAKVDNNGCPLDSDHDGVPDGLDDCPNSEPGLPVDQTGCIDLSILEKPMILNIKYYPGSFEIDRKSKEMLDSLYMILKKAPGVKVEIAGYTDNIGTSEANRLLSEKRARRVREYLISLGIDGNRLTAVGKGEMNFIASNATQEGRQKNRRVELTFFK
jgi:outer membrane protein OmpA-like peptidoglycan-associated protein